VSGSAHLDGSGRALCDDGEDADRVQMRLICVLRSMLTSVQRSSYTVSVPVVINRYVNGRLCHYTLLVRRRRRWDTLLARLCL